MKNMAFQFKQANEAEKSAELVAVLTELIALTNQALQAEFPPDKAEQFKQGLQQVLRELQAAKAAAQEENLSQVKSHLLQVDALRKDYHQQRKVSIWQLLFG